MSDLQEIKQRIYNENQIEELLHRLDCWGVSTEQNKQLFVAGLPDGDNERSVQIRNTEQLPSHIRTKGISGDIFDIISYIIFNAESKEDRLTSLPKSKIWLCKEFGYVEFIDEFYKETMADSKPKVNYNKWLQSVKKNREEVHYILENSVYPKTILNNYGVIPYKKWLDEGISCKTQKEFGVGIDVISDRVTFPVFNKSNELIGVKGRYCGKDKNIEDRYKYLYLYPCNKSVEFFNLNRALPYIKDKKEVIVVEGAKTIMYLSQWGFKNSISIEGDSLSDAQIKILKQLGISTKFIFAWDKDKDAKFIKNELDRLKGRLKYSIYDKGNLLSDKDSPCDKGIEIWNNLYKNNLYKIN